jgi:predicted acyl esterase
MGNRFGFWEEHLWSTIFRLRHTLVFAVVFGELLFVTPCSAQSAGRASSSDLSSETPETFTPVTSSFDYVKREAMIPMRDGVKAHTVILVPKGAKSAPILLTRTPYSAKDLTSHAASSHLGPILYGL